MDNYTRLLNFLKSEDFKNFIYENYSEYINKLNQELRNPDVFMSYCRAFIIDAYYMIDDDKKNTFVNKIIKKGLLETEIEYLTFRLNACSAKPNDHINKESKKFFAELEPYKDSIISKSLSQYREEIFNMLSEEMRVYTIKQIKDGDYEILERDSDGRMSEIILEDSEIKTIEAAHKAGELFDLGHILYDDIKYVKRPSILGGFVIDNLITCDYEKADNDGVGNIVFNTLKDRPRYELDIVFEDGIIMQYHQGNIKKKPYTIDQMMTYIYADVTKILKELGFDENNISSIDSDTLMSTIEDACIEVCSQSDFLEEIYSKKMISDSKKYVKKLIKIAKEENL